MDRSSLQRLARLRLEEARALLDAGKPSGAYYLAGYAAECGLKACIAKLTKEHAFPPDPKFIRDVYTHDLQTLLGAAGLRYQLEQDGPKGSRLDQNWGVAFKWSERWRYAEIPEQEARDLINAIVASNDGVLAWLERYW